VPAHGPCGQRRLWRLPALGPRLDARHVEPALTTLTSVETKWLEDFVSLAETRSFSCSAQFRKGDTQLAALINDTFRQLAEDHELERRYNRRFLRRLSGQSIDLPMSPPLDSIFRSLGAVPE
jgi:hypothetical protein